MGTCFINVNGGIVQEYAGQSEMIRIKDFSYQVPATFWAVLQQGILLEINGLSAFFAFFPVCKFLQITKLHRPTVCLLCAEVGRYFNWLPAQSHS